MYSKRTNSELLGILEQYDLLTFESQLSLREELKKRAIVVDTSNLEMSISQKLAEIKDLFYLKDFGFEAVRTADGGLTITRTKKAILTDVVALLIGLLVFLIGIYGCIDLVMTFVNGDELDVFTLAFKFAVAALLFIGLGFFSGLKRLFDYAGFKLSNLNGIIILKKRFDVKLEEIKANTSNLFLETDEDTLFLKLGNRTIFTSNADNLIQSMTLKELTKELKKG